MVNNLCNAYYAGRLIYRSLAASEREIRDAEHRELISEFISNSVFRDLVNDIARGLELTILDATMSGLVLAPASAESKFALKISDLKSNLEINQKVGLLLSQIVIAATFFPTTESLEDESYSAPPASLIDFRNNLESFLHRIKEAPSLERDDDGTIAAGWQFLLTLPQANPNSERAALNSLNGYVKTSINHLEQGGMLAIERKSMSDEQTLYAPTFRMRVHLREFALQQIYDLAKPGARTAEPQAATKSQVQTIELLADAQGLSKPEIEASPMQPDSQAQTKPEIEASPMQPDSQAQTKPEIAAAPMQPDSQAQTKPEIEITPLRSETDRLHQNEQERSAEKHEDSLITQVRETFKDNAAMASEGNQADQSGAVLTLRTSNNKTKRNALAEQLHINFTSSDSNDPAREENENA